MKLVFLHSILFQKRKRAVSPVIGSILIIALAATAITGVVAVLNNAFQGTPNAQTNQNQVQFGTRSLDGSVDLGVSISLGRLVKNFNIFATEGKSYYTSLLINLNYPTTSSGPNNIYVIDFDIFIYGVKLDEIASWTIVSAVGATQSLNNQNQYEGYKQAKGTTATYNVSMSAADLQQIQARIPTDTSFTYQAKIGTSPGVINYFVSNQELSKLVLDAVNYNITMFDYGQNLASTSSALNFIINVLDQYDYKNKVHFNYNPLDDIYNTANGMKNSRGLTPVNQYGNYTAFANRTDIIIVAEWAVVNNVQFAQLLNTAHKNSVPIVFFGTITNIRSNINATATAELTGLSVNSQSISRRSGTLTMNFNSTVSTNPTLISDIEGYSEAVSSSRSDGYNLAAVDNTYVNALTYGTDTITTRTFRRWGTTTINSIMYAYVPSNQTNTSGPVSTFSIDQQKSTKSDIVLRNMIFNGLAEGDRLRITDASLQETNMNSFVWYSQTSCGGRWRWNCQSTYNVHFEVALTLIGSSIKADGLNFTLTIPYVSRFNRLRAISWTVTPTDAYIQLNNGALLPISVTLQDNGVNSQYITINLGNVLSGIITPGSVIKIIIPGSSSWYIRNSDRYLYYPWTYSLEWTQLNNVFGTFQSTQFTLVKSY